MVGKFFVLAFLCVSLAQVQGDSLESAVRVALAKLKNIDASTSRQIDNTVNNIAKKQELLESKAALFLEKELEIEEQKEQALNKVAELYKKKAEDAKKPEETFECIEKAKNNAVKRIEALGPKFEVDIRRLEKTKLNSIEVASRPLEGLKDSLPERYENAAAEIQNSKDTVSVRKNLARAFQGYRLLSADLRRIEGQVNTAFGQFSKDAGLFLSNLSRQAAKIQTDGARDIKTCVYRKSLLEE